MGLFDIAAKDKSLKIQWLTRLHGQDQVLTVLAYYHINTPLRNEIFWQCNFNTNDVKFICKANGFWQSVVLNWAEFNFNVPQSTNYVIQQVKWFNSHIRENYKPVFNEKMYEHGVLPIADIVQNGKLSTYPEFAAKFTNQVPFIEYYQILSAIPKEWKALLATEESEVVNISNKYEELMQFEKIAKSIYNKMATDV